MPAKRPSAAWLEKFVKAAALNAIAARGAPIRTQQRLYERWMKLRAEGEEKWPHIDFEMGLDSAVESWLSQHPLRGPGVDW